MVILYVWFYSRCYSFDGDPLNGSIREEVSATMCLRPYLDAKLYFCCVWFLYHTFRVGVEFLYHFFRIDLCRKRLYSIRVCLNEVQVVTVGTAFPAVTDVRIRAFIVVRAVYFRKQWSRHFLHARGPHSKYNPSGRSKVATVLRSGPFRQMSFLLNSIASEVFIWRS